MNVTAAFSRLGAVRRAGLALMGALALTACAGGPEPIPGPETTTRDINEDIRATMPSGEEGSRPALPGEGLPPVTVDPRSRR
jgi:hypothetical protein